MTLPGWGRWPLASLLAAVLASGAIRVAAGGTAGVTQDPILDPPLFRLFSPLVAASPPLDGSLEGGWGSAPELPLPMLAAGESRPARVLALRSLHTRAEIFMRASWEESDRSLTATRSDSTSKLAMHWGLRQQEPSLPPGSCLAACHTAYAGRDARIQDIHLVSFNSADPGALAGAGAWKDGQWLLVWRRLLVTSSPFDVQFTDLGRSYSFRVALYAGGDLPRVQDSPPAELVFAD